MNPRNAPILMSIALTLPLLLVGCDKEVSHTGSNATHKDGSSSSEDTTVTKSSDGKVTTKETFKSTESDGEQSSQTKTTVRSPDGTVTQEESKKITPAP